MRQNKDSSDMILNVLEFLSSRENNVINASRKEGVLGQNDVRSFCLCLGVKVFELVLL